MGIGQGQISGYWKPGMLVLLGKQATPALVVDKGYVQLLVLYHGFEMHVAPWVLSVGTRGGTRGPGPIILPARPACWEAQSF